MIKNIIFDFGDVFINLNKSATPKALQQLGYDITNHPLQAIDEQYEMGKMSTDTFLQNYLHHLPSVTKEQLISAWNAILIDFPVYRFKFMQEKVAQAKNYKLIMLSNTNDLHINWVKNNVPFYEEFKNLFDAFYLSHEIHYRKPNKDIFQFVLDENQLIPEETLFIDDTTANTNTAQSLGINIWNNDPKKEDVIELFELKSNLF